MGNGKTSGAFRFACPFLCFFLLGKQKKERKEQFVPNKESNMQYLEKNAASPLHLKYKHYPNAIAKKIFIIPLSLYPLLACQCPTTKNKKGNPIIPGWYAYPDPGIFNPRRITA